MPEVVGAHSNGANGDPCRRSHQVSEQGRATQGKLVNHTMGSPPPRRKRGGGSATAAPRSLQWQRVPAAPQPRTT